jgi:hypothetical protein
MYIAQTPFQVITRVCEPLTGTYAKKTGEQHPPGYSLFLQLMCIFPICASSES